MKKKGTVFFIPHGGGPLPILEDPGHTKMIKFLKKARSAEIENEIISIKDILNIIPTKP